MNDLLSADARYTLFAPADEHWHRLDEGTLEHLGDIEQRATLIAIVQHHVVRTQKVVTT